MTTTQSLTCMVALRLIIFAVANVAQAQTSSTMEPSIEIDDRDPEASMPDPKEVKNPLDYAYLVMELEDRAGAARARDDWQASLRYHRAMLKLAPDNVAPFRSLCQDYDKLGQRAEAISACRQVLGLPGSRVGDYAQLVRLVATRPGGTDRQEVEDAQAAIDHLKREASTEAAGHQLQCELSASTGDRVALKDCATRLVSLAPNEASTITFGWSLAMQERDFVRARELVRKAKERGFEQGAVARMEQALASAETEGGAGAVVAGLQARLPAAWRWSLGVALAALLAVVARRWVRTRSAYR